MFRWGHGYLKYIFILHYYNGVVSHLTPPKGPHMQLVEQLMREYGPPFCRPVSEYNKTIVVEFFMFINQVLSFNERDQMLKVSGQLDMTWYDEYLVWNETEYPAVETVKIPISKISHPEVHLYESSDFATLIDGLPWIYPDGRIFLAVPMIFTTMCRVDARFFPFDTQRCQSKFGSWVYPTRHMNLVLPERNASDSSINFVENGVWDLTDVLFHRNDTLYVEYGNFAEIVFTLVLTRRPTFYVLTVTIPCILLSVINVMVFILPTESGEKVSLGITNVLALVLFQQLIAEIMPPTSDKSPLISYYFTPMIITGCLAVMTGVIVAYLHQQDGKSDVPKWFCLLAKKSQIQTKPVYNCSVGQNIIDSDNEGNGSSDPNLYDKSQIQKHQTLSLEENNAEIENTYTNLYKSTDAGTKMGNTTSMSDTKYNGHLFDDIVAWKDIATAINRIMLSVCLCITVVSIVVIGFCFKFMSRDC
ncbi:neuronal acetylcholine receptor subunit alpha-7-like [Amphiura filiformis]|uniref:neuronal acetylcholine receptor subunit alpha-7-like n=1 Tax=Amphiura filiformis TaxID=82378 RepID=UPI003B21B224